MGDSAIESSVTAVDGPRSEPVREFSDALLELLRVYQFRDRQRSCIHGISVTECYLLELLVTDGPGSVSELADQMRLNKSTTSRAVASLEEKGYVQRHEHPTDARRVALRPTEAGRRLHEAIREGLRERQRRLLDDFDSETTLRIARLLRRLAREEPSRSGVLRGDR